jgi:methylmalonyl-CoA mutase
MLPRELSLREDFPPVGYDQWRSLVEADLKGASFQRKLVTRTYEGIDIQPVYRREDHPGEGDPDGFPGLSPFVRGSSPLGAVLNGWDLRQEHAHPDLAVSNDLILRDLDGGVSSLLLRLDVAARQGLDPDQSQAADRAGQDGLMVYNADDFQTLLADVHLHMVGITLEAGAAFLPAAAALVATWQRQDISPAQARGALNADPLAVLARDGQIPFPPSTGLQLLADLACWTARNYPHVTAVRVGTAPYHHAGASAAQDLAFGMATGVEYLRAMTAAGLEIDEAAQQILFSIGLGTHHFLAIAKLRAARRIWARLVEACGGSPAAQAMRLHARTSKRVLTERDPYVNLLRNTAAVFAAGVAGVDAITSVPFDTALGLPDAFSRRVARNTVLVLQEEAHLHRVVDPSGGSWYLDWLTDQVAEKAWGLFQDIERRGGMLAAIESGWVAGQIESAFAPRAERIADRRDGITGVSEFPNLSEEPVRRPPPDLAVLRAAAVERVGNYRREAGPVAAPGPAGERMAAAVEAAGRGATIGQISAALGFHQQPTSITPLTPHPFAEPFEQLRDASDEWLRSHGQRPRVFLANMGPIAHHTARATFSKNFFEAGGFEVVTNRGFADAAAASEAYGKSQASIAVICSSDKLYPDVVPQVGPRLKAAGARTVILAGHPGENETAWREAGVDRFIYVKCDVLATLRELLLEEGVLN